MFRQQRARTAWIVAGMLAVGVAGPVRAAGDDEQGSANRWVPSLSLGFNVYEENPTGEVGPPPGQPFRDVDKEPDTITSIRFGGQLMTPEVVPASGIDIRLFAGGGAAVFPDQEKIASEQGDRVLDGEPEKITASRQRTLDSVVNSYYTIFNTPGCAPLFNTQGCRLPTIPNFRVNSISEGQGFPGQLSEVSALHHNPSWFVQLGFAYTMPWNDFYLRFKPSVEYVGEKIRVKGRYFNVTSMPGSAGVIGPDPLNLGRTFRVDRVRGAETQIFHEMGPAFELEAVVRDSGWVIVSVFGGVKYLWAVGDRELTFRDDNGLGVQFKYRRRAGGIRGGGGVRIGWRGPSIR